MLSNGFSDKLKRTYFVTSKFCTSVCERLSALTSWGLHSERRSARPLFPRRAATNLMDASGECTRQSPAIFPFAIQSAATQPKRIGKVCLYVACGQDRGTATLISSLTAERASSQFNVTRRPSAAGCRLQPLHQSTTRHSPLGIVND